MNIACCQMDIRWEDKPANYARAHALIAAAAPAPGSLVLLPEMFATGFSMNVAGIAENGAGETAAFLARTAMELGIFLLGGLVTTAPDGRGRNEAVVFSPEGKELSRYHKMHPFTFGGETEHYAPGVAPVSFMLDTWTAAPFICYDLRFPEVFRSAAQRGAQLFTVVANWPEAREAHWVLLLRARAVENQAYVAGVNRVGSDPRVTYSGRSLIVDPRGEIIADGGSAEGVIQANLDKEALLDYRNAFPALQDIHTEYVL